MEIKETYTIQKQSPLEKLENFANIVSHVCIGFVTIYMSYLCLGLGLKKTALHAWLCTLGFHLLMAEAIMFHYSNNALTLTYSRRTRTILHWILQLIGSVCSIWGIADKISYKEVHFTTTHGKLGLAALILLCLSLFLGLSAYYSQKLKKTLTPVLNKTLHNFLGLVCFVLGLAAFYYGYETGFWSRSEGANLTTLMKILTLLTLFLTSIGPLKSIFLKFSQLCQSW